MSVCQYVSISINQPVCLSKMHLSLCIIYIEFILEQKLPKKSNLKSSEKKEIDSKEMASTVQQDAISSKRNYVDCKHSSPINNVFVTVLLQKGTRLKEDIVKSQLVENKQMLLEKSKSSSADDGNKPVENFEIPRIMVGRVAIIFVG